MVPSILRGKQPRYLPLWWDFCDVVWFYEVFLFSWGIVVFNSCLFDGVCFLYSQVFISFFFFRGFWFFLHLVILFLPSFVVFRFSLLEWLIFHAKFHSLSSLYIVTECVRVSICFHFGKHFDVVHVHGMVDLFLPLMRVVPTSAFINYVIK